MQTTIEYDGYESYLRKTGTTGNAPTFIAADRPSFTVAPRLYAVRDLRCHRWVISDGLRTGRARALGACVFVLFLFFLFLLVFSHTAPRRVPFTARPALRRTHSAFAREHGFCATARADAATPPHSETVCFLFFSSWHPSPSALTAPCTPRTVEGGGRWDAFRSSLAFVCARWRIACQDFGHPTFFSHAPFVDLQINA